MPFLVSCLTKVSINHVIYYLFIYLFIYLIHLFFIYSERVFYNGIYTEFSRFQINAKYTRLRVKKTFKNFKKKKKKWYVVILAERSS